ncbi:MAG TPA: sulfite exporter TauE/SafE family protein [Steroidobacteraceae bacterium]|nr:sulfite exporter TauE/SafE family protein [Steroidobacteraceae bacterium]
MTSTVLLISLALFCGGWVKGVFGMGLPTVALGLLSLTMPPVEAATLIVVPTLATNAWQFATGPQRAAVTARFAILLIGVAIGTVVGVGFLTGSHTSLVSLALGGVLIAYAAIGMLSAKLHVSSSAERWASPVVGFATGIVNGATGVSVMPLVPYLNSIGLQREALIQAMGLIFMTAMLALAACLAWTGHFVVASAGASTLALLPVFAGMYAGQLVRLRLHAGAYRKWFFIGLIVLGMYSVIRATLQIVR